MGSIGWRVVESGREVYFFTCAEAKSVDLDSCRYYQDVYQARREGRSCCPGQGELHFLPSSSERQCLAVMLIRYKRMILMVQATKKKRVTSETPEPEQKEPVTKSGKESKTSMVRFVSPLLRLRQP